MNIFHKVALHGLKGNRTRTLVTIIGVALSSALVTGVVTFGVSLLSYMMEGAAVKYGGWHAAFLDVDAVFVKEQEGDGRVTQVTAFENIGYARLDSGQNPDKPCLSQGFRGKPMKRCASSCSLAGCRRRATRLSFRPI